MSEFISLAWNFPRTWWPHGHPWLAHLYSGEAEPSGVWDVTSTHAYLPCISHLYGQRCRLTWHPGPKNLKVPLVVHPILTVLYCRTFHARLVAGKKLSLHGTSDRAAPNQSNVTTASEQNAERTLYQAKLGFLLGNNLNLIQDSNSSSCLNVYVIGC